MSATLRPLTLAMEFVSTAIRAVADGHAPDGVHTTDAVNWAKEQLDLFLAGR